MGRERRGAPIGASRGRDFREGFIAFDASEEGLDAPPRDDEDETRSLGDVKRVGRFASFFFFFFFLSVLGDLVFGFGGLVKFRSNSSSYLRYGNFGGPGWALNSIRPTPVRTSKC